MSINKLCPCHSNKMYAACCEPLHNGAPASSAEALMRSRYCAFALGLDDYIQDSWHLSTRPPRSENHADEIHKTHWLSLHIKRHDIIDASHALVEFVARYKINGRAFVLHETSRFIRTDGHWFYLDGDIH